MQEQTGIWAIFKREWLRIFSSKICIWGIFVAPILCMLILFPMMNQGLPNKIPIAVVDLDNSATSRGLIRQLDAFPKTDIILKSLSFTEAREKMERAEIFAVFLIPEEFSKKAVLGERPKLSFYTNNAFLISGSLLFQDLKTISVLASAAVGLQTAEAQGYTEGQIMPVLQPINIDAHPIGNPWLNYSIYLNNILLPGVLQLLMLLFTVSAIGSEVKAGTGRLLMRMGNNSIINVMIGKMLPYTFLFLMMSLLFMSVLYGYNHFPLHTGFFPMFFNYLFFILACQGLGIVFVGAFCNYRFSLSISSLIGSLGFSITGFSFPAIQMDPSLYALSFLFPLRHFFLIYVDQALNGLPFGYSAYQYAVLLCFLALSFFLFPRIKNFLNNNLYEG